MGITRTGVSWFFHLPRRKFIDVQTNIKFKPNAQVLIGEHVGKLRVRKATTIVEPPGSTRGSEGIESYRGPRPTNDDSNRSITPRDYQIAAAVALYKALDEPGSKPLVVVPTGGGKSIITAVITRDWRRNHPHSKIIVVARSHIILAHNSDALRRVDPRTIPVMFRGGPLAPGATFATAQKLFRYPGIVADADLVIIDECDQAYGDEVKQYGAILYAARRYCGLTGTPFRLRSGETTPIFGAGLAFDPPCYFISKKDLTARGLIVPVEQVRTATAFDVSRLRVNDAGYYETKLISVEPDMLAIVANDVRAVITANPCPFLVYALTIDQAEKQASALNAVGVKTAVLDGRMTKTVRASIEADFRAGNYRGVCSVQVIDRGADFPTALDGQLGGALRRLRRVRTLAAAPLVNSALHLDAFT
jgi:superfamily II DNA or RNA helicase